ncbi:DNA sulfur modification protein DndE [Paenibacillus sp. FSL W7-1287]|uniref:DNA sulfur modification protein DndE n=1 Tax=Paenibacillus sp. FSL W7-1287 TaxID=2954538 RepID=UPI0030FB4543
MQYRLKTTKATAERLKELQSKTNLTPNILARIAVSLSLREKEKVELINIPLLGLDFNRSTLTGKYDFLYKALITEFENREVTDDEFFPDLFNAHLERGTAILEREYIQASNVNKLMRNLVDKVESV